MKLLVTGADGLLGSNAVRILLERGHDVRIFAQPFRQQKTLEGLRLERFEGDLLNREEVIKAAAGCEAIIHIAANTSVWPSRSEIVNKVNIDGTKNIIEAAAKAAVKKLVYVGTANSFAYGSKEHPGVETNPYNADKYGLDYMDSKYKAQQLVLKAVKEGLPAVIVNPTFMFGPYDSMPSSGAMILAVYNKTVPGYSPGGKNYVYVKDAATALVNALTMGRVGECYILGHENLSFREAFKKIGDTIGVPVPDRKMPAIAVKAFGLFNTLMAKAFNKRPSVSYELAVIACDHHYYSAAKAVKELNMPQTPIEVGIKEAFDWLKENGYLK
ncbi:MAG: NAD-dependent epimerase/dehydratase family protein [Bacteroidia bacterium]